MVTKISILKRHAAAGDWRKAISMAAKFPRLGKERNIILDAQLAYTNPRFIKQIGKDPEKLIRDAIEAIRIKYKINTTHS
jgi:hypothetical protein